MSAQVHIGKSLVKKPWPVPLQVHIMSASYLSHSAKLLQARIASLHMQLTWHLLQKQYMSLGR